MSFHYVLKNDSHLFVARKPASYRPTGDHWKDEILGELYIRTMNIKPILVNCTVAPLAEGCSPSNSTNNLKTLIKPVISHLSNSLMSMYKSFINSMQKHLHIIIIIIIIINTVFIFILIFLLIYNRRRFYSAIQKPTLTITQFASKLIL
jgi:hypothetical protein